MRRPDVRASHSLNRGQKGGSDTETRPHVAKRIFISTRDDHSLVLFPVVWLRGRTPTGHALEPGVWGAS